jgi:alkanesulfonate monooxygenase SsuD/methylene tetrahydromethanopterin reductase-like flavin-dependent oxidoreductase (luciferase family)
MSWPEIAEAARLGEELGFEALYAADHLMAVAGFSEEAGLLDGLALVLALAPVTRSLRLGTMVSPITVRHPVVLARELQTLDLVSGGRAEVGLGAGWSADEHAAFGLPFPPTAERLDRLEAACRALRALWEEDQPVELDGPYPLHGARLRPRPVQRQIPLLVAGASDRAVSIAARFARRWNATGSAAFLAERIGRLRQEERAAGRPAGSTEATATVRLLLTEDQAAAEAARAALRASPVPQRAQRRSVAPGEDPTGAIYVGPAEGLPEHLAQLEAVGVERAVLPVPRPWDPNELRRLAGLLRWSPNSARG